MGSVIGSLLASEDVLPIVLVPSCVCRFRDRGAGVIRSCGERSSRLPSLFAIGLVLRIVAAPPLNRTIRGLPDRVEAGEAVRSLKEGLKDERLLLSVGWWSPFDARSLSTPLRCDGDDPMAEASSPRMAFASALNFIGGTGTSSSELSPIENFQASGKGPSSVGLT